MVKPNTSQKVSSKKDITIMERRRYITNEKEESKQNITIYHHNYNHNNI